MTTTNRRNFIVGSAMLGAAMTVSAQETLASEQSTAQNKDRLPHLLHHVFFWLKNPDSAEDRAALITGIKSLAAIETVQAIHVGVAASTEQRDVVEAGYDVSELLCFDDVEGQNVYQVHPLHQAFVEKYSHLWRKVVVYDTVSV